MMQLALARPLARYAPLWPWLQAAGIVVLAAFWLLAPTGGFDAASYHSLDLSDPYRVAWHEPGSFVYSPAFGQMLYPFTLLPAVVFEKLLLAANLVALVWLIGPAWGALSLALLPVTSELLTGQIHLLLGVALVVGMRHPWTWAFVLLTKVTPGIGLLWFAVRREWWNLGIALGVTVGVVALSALVWPSAWVEWIGFIRESSGRVDARYTFINTPLVLRLVAAVVLTVLAAWRDRPAALPLIVLLSLPAVWFSALVLLAAIPRLLQIKRTKAYEGRISESGPY